MRLTVKQRTYNNVKKVLQNEGINIDLAEISWIPSSLYRAWMRQKARSIVSLMEKLENHDDVQNVYANFSLTRKTCWQSYNFQIGEFPVLHLNYPPS